MRTKYVDIEKYILDDLQVCLDSPGTRKPDTIATFTANFGGGLEADIKVCNTESDSKPYVDAVLFQDGCEVGLLDVGDELAGEYLFDDPDNPGEELQVIVREETPESSGGSIKD